jgi:predicted acetyltransferase
LLEARTFKGRSAITVIRKISGIKKALVTCDKGNIGSAKAIIKNHGVLENELTEENGNIVQRYWIDIPDCIIKPIAESDLPTCLDVIHYSFATIADEFGLTVQSCPNHTSFMKLDKLQKQFSGGFLMYGLFERDKIVGYVSLSANGNGYFELNNLAVLPYYRHNGYGKKLIEFAKNKVLKLGGNKITIGIIEENTRLKEWYAENGFVYTGAQIFPHLPFTVGFMEMEI